MSTRSAGARVGALGAGLTLAASCVLGAQPAPVRGAMVTVVVAPETVAVGQPFAVRVRVRAPKSATLRFPALPDSADAIEAMDPRTVEESPSESVLDQTAVYRVAAWSVGAHSAKVAPVVVTTGGVATNYPVIVPPVFVLATLPADTTQQIPKDARDPFPVPSGLWRLVLILLIIGALTAWYLVRRRRAPRAAPTVLEPYVATAAAFRALEMLALADAGEAGRHVIAHVDVLRAYLAQRFPAASVALTPAELRATLATADFPVLPERLDALLRADAAIRFAHAPVLRHDAVALAAEARAIARDVQEAHEQRVRAAERGPQRPRRR